MRLKDACAVQTGYTARSRLPEPTSLGGVLTIQLRDIAADGRIDPARLARVSLDGLPDRYFVRTGDVVFRSRGERNTASLLDGRFREPALALLPLLILRANRHLVTPEYLAWAINQPRAQRHFDGAARGSKMRMIPRPAVDDLELDVPDLDTQATIVAVDALAERERELAIVAAETRRRLTILILAQRVSTMRPDAGPERKAT